MGVNSVRQRQCPRVLQGHATSQHETDRVHEGAHGGCAGEGRQGHEQGRWQHHRRCQIHPDGPRRHFPHHARHEAVLRGAVRTPDPRDRVRRYRHHPRLRTERRVRTAGQHLLDHRRCRNGDHAGGQVLFRLRQDQHQQPVRAIAGRAAILGSSIIRHGCHVGEGCAEGILHPDGGILQGRWCQCRHCFRGGQQLRLHEEHLEAVRACLGMRCCNAI
mmetsp:Transcript_19391/g.53945  ORF Transcript_19391/g.53945 Transcript_19391/m.53945 type:complete len:217 (+) Transcript_19391:175-825(+)